MRISLRAVLIVVFGDQQCPTPRCPHSLCSASVNERAGNDTPRMRSWMELTVALSSVT